MPSVPVKHRRSSPSASVVDANAKILRLHHVPAYFLMISLLVALYFLYRTLEPFFTVIVFAAVLAAAFHPLYKKILQWVKRPIVASLLACLIVTLLIVVPLIVVFLLLSSEAVNAYTIIQMKLNSGFLDPLFRWNTGGFLYDLYQKYLPGLNLSHVDLSGQITGIAQQISTFLIEKTQMFVSGLLGFFMSFLIMGVTLFYFFKDGEVIAQKILSLSPLPKIYEKKMLSHLHLMTRATLYGTFLTAIVQGVVCGIGFALSGLGQPVLWGTVTAFFALLPYIGTGFVWIPGSIILFALGHTGSAIFLFLWGMFIVGTIDNFLHPYLVGNSMQSDTLLTFLCVLGGILVWGFPGVVFGPLVLTMLMALIEIYQQEYHPMLKGLDHDGV